VSVMVPACRTLPAMLIVSGTIEFDPANHDKIVDLLGPLVEATLAETGNITYGMWADPANPGRMLAYEEWETEDALNEHMGTDHMATFMVGMAECGVTGTAINKHVVSESSKLM
jgi:quinol monooxygenase YgiN